MTLIALIVLPVTGVLIGRDREAQPAATSSPSRETSATSTARSRRRYAGPRRRAAPSTARARRERVRRRSTRGSTARRGRAQFLSGPHDRPCTSVRGQARATCAVVVLGGVACRARHHHRSATSRHSSSYVTELHAAHHAAGADRQRSCSTMAAAAERIFAFLGEPEVEAEPALPAPADAHPRRRGVPTTCASATIPTQPVIHDCLCDGAGGPDRGASSARPAPARPPWSSCSCASTMLTRAPSASAARDVRDYARAT